MILRVPSTEYGATPEDNENMLELLDSNGYYSGMCVVSAFTNPASTYMEFFLMSTASLIITSFSMNRSPASLYFIQKDYLHPDPLTIGMGEEVCYFTNDTIRKVLKEGDNENKWIPVISRNSRAQSNSAVDAWSKELDYAHIDPSIILPITKSLLSTSASGIHYYGPHVEEGITPMMYAKGKVVELNDGALFLSTGVMIDVKQVLDPMKLIPFMV